MGCPQSHSKGLPYVEICSLMSARLTVYIVGACDDLEMLSQKILSGFQTRVSANREKY